MWIYFPHFVKKIFCHLDDWMVANDLSLMRVALTPYFTCMLVHFVSGRSVWKQLNSMNYSMYRHLFWIMWVSYVFSINIFSYTKYDYNWLCLNLKFKVLLFFYIGFLIKSFHFPYRCTPITVVRQFHPRRSTTTARPTACLARKTAQHRDESQEWRRKHDPVHNQWTPWSRQKTTPGRGSADVGRCKGENRVP